MPRIVNSVEKAKDFKGSFKKLIKYLKGFVSALIVVMVLVVFSTICRLVGPNKLGDITDLINPSTTQSFKLEDVLSIGQFLIVLYVCAFVSTYIANVVLGRVTFLVTRDLRRDISKKINKLPLKYLDSTPYGDVLSRITNDVDIIGQTLMNSVSSFVGAVVMLLGSLIMMFVIILCMIYWEMSIAF